MSVFHSSCLDQIKGAIIVSGHTIYCSERCKQKGNDETLKTDKLLRDISETKKLLKHKSNENEEIQMKFGEKLQEMQSEIDKLKQEITEKDRFISRLQRRTKYFEDEVMEEEQSFITKLQTQIETIERLKKEITEKDSEITKLKEEKQRSEEECNITKHVKMNYMKYAKQSHCMKKMIG
ncbi:hypothetical protein JTB14_009051 [Gonioctena quinquepunctata]|nr:hypothetical protein JTB14_009051 [Gonioctena quinquepunctata]